MKIILLSLLLIQSASAQWHRAETTSFERLGWYTGAIALDLGYDLLMYPKILKDNGGQEPRWIWAFHGSQFVLRGLMTYFLWQNCGWATAIAYNVAWLFWSTDLLYYQVWEVRHPGSIQGLMKAKHVYWGKFTPVGWFQKDVSPISLVIQGWTGIGLGISLTVF